MSICLITYNHANYIRQAIDAVLSQKTDFSWELIIADDFSTDGTREILLEYKQKYPECITLILQEKNVGAAKNWIELITSPQSKYIAYFEGDDYWVDNHKLQKQVDFLEANEMFSLCFHNATFLDISDGSTKLFRNSSKKIYYTRDVILSKWFCPSASILFRRTAINNFPIIDKHIANGDLVLLFIASLQGPLYYIDEVMSVYRCGIPGSMSAKSKSKGALLPYMNILNYLSYINRITYNKYILYILMKKIYVILAIFKNVIIKK